MLAIQDVTVRQVPQLASATIADLKHFEAEALPLNHFNQVPRLADTGDRCVPSGSLARIAGQAPA